MRHRGRHEVTDSQDLIDASDEPSHSEAANQLDRASNSATPLETGNLYQSKFSLLILLW